MELGRMLECGELDARDLTEYFIERINSGSDFSAFISTCFDRARREAAQSAERHKNGRARGILDGVPIAWKDIIDVAGVTTTAGSALFRQAQPAHTDAAIVRLLAQAGMVSLGKTNLTEFANSALGLNPHFGTPRNPHARDVARAPGGSSSGSAVAVAAGLVPVAMGTDTGGSIRTPAAFNGIVGFKTSEGWYDNAGVFPLSPTLDTVGMLARCVADCSLLNSALRAGRAAPPSGNPETISDLRIAVPENVIGWSDADVRENFLASLARLAAAGAKIVWRTLPELDQLHKLMAEHGTISMAEAYWSHREQVEGVHRSSMDQRVLDRIMKGKAMSACDLVALQQGRLQCRQSVWGALDQDLLMMPTVPHVAPPLAPLEADIEHFLETNAKTTCYTVLVNLLNGCSLTLPNGSGEGAMPTGISLSLPAGGEERLLRIGMLLEASV